jgi:predicted neutral ceramidase superfamily lipid hydrolase
MDVEEIVALSIALFVVLCFVLVESTEIFAVLLLICLAASLQLSGFFIPREAKVVLKSLVYLLLIVFIGIVVKKALEVLR